MNDEISTKPFIVVGVDGSEQSVKALKWAVEHAQLLGANVHAVGVWDVPGTIFLTPAYAESDYGDDAERGFNEAIATALEELGEVGEGVVVVKNLAQGNPSKVLHDAALGAVSLVVGSHGYQDAFPGMHLGSTASYCVHHAPCPVVVIRNTVSY